MRAEEAFFTITVTSVRIEHGMDGVRKSKIYSSGTTT
jgi:hypothetical protein